ncbi:peptidoglycan DD-metalloendopeptidase family protein [Marinifilum sp.]|uniref:peptidoglycan DD-metalloendopeptidase family protein n=1 Tax=Marinifilum sp. TaxID=2033137 RepID=UPI003BAB47CC
MTEFLKYIIESSLCMAAFYLLYKFFLSRDTFVMRNRIYLLFSVLISLLIPLISFSIETEQINVFNQFALDPVEGVKTAIVERIELTKETYIITPISILLLIYLLGVLVSFIRISKHLIGIIKTIFANEIIEKNNLKIVSVQENTSPYSFFRYVFLNPHKTSKSEQNHILLHESVHVKQCHTIDLIFLEIVKVLMWFNPFIYFIQHSLVEMHEYLADRACIKSGTDRIEYQNALVQNIEGRMRFALTSAFNSSLTLKRIKMIKKIKSSHFSNLKLILVLPILFFAVVSFGFIKSTPAALEGNFDTYYESEKFHKPVPTGNKIYMTSGYGERYHPIKKKKIFHRGIDIAAPKGTRILSIADGVVRKVNLNYEQGKGYGRFVIVDYADGLSALYSQMNSYSVKEGQKVKAGDVLGTIGSSGISTGPHLHLEIKKDGKNVNPEDYINTNIYKKK